MAIILALLLDRGVLGLEPALGQTKLPLLVSQVAIQEGRYLRVSVETIF